MKTQKERLDYLVQAFQAESDEFKDIQIPKDIQGKQNLLRSLMNIRMPGPMADETIQIQDEYLKECAIERGVVSLDDITAIRNHLSIWQGDITRLKVDAIVNAANSQMLGCFIPMHTCIDNCIHTYAGIQLRAECDRQMKQKRVCYGQDYEQPTGVPMLTDAYNLPSKKIIHVTGPIVQDKLTPALEKELADCYINVLDMCRDNELRSVAFCCISTGVFRFPNKIAAEIAVDTVKRWLNDHPETMDRVIFNVFKDEDRNYYEELI